jgi:hypothetical protein
LINAYFHDKDEGLILQLNCWKLHGSYQRKHIWNVEKKETLHPATAAMILVLARAFAVNASATTLKAGSCPDAASLTMLKKPGIDPSNILPAWFPRREFSR